MHYVARGDVLFLQQPKREGKMHFESETEIFIRKQNKTKSKDENMAFDQILLILFPQVINLNEYANNL